MTPVDVLTATAVPNAEWEALEARLQDPDWVAAEFAAIMKASGMTAHVRVGLLPDPRLVTAAVRPRRSRGPGVVDPRRSSDRSRVRSPPRE